MPDKLVTIRIEPLTKSQNEAVVFALREKEGVNLNLKPSSGESYMTMRVTPTQANKMKRHLEKKPGQSVLIKLSKSTLQKNKTHFKKTGQGLDILGQLVAPLLNTIVSSNTVPGLVTQSLLAPVGHMASSSLSEKALEKAGVPITSVAHNLPDSARHAVRAFVPPAVGMLANAATTAATKSPTAGLVASGAAQGLTDTALGQFGLGVVDPNMDPVLRDILKVGIPLVAGGLGGIGGFLAGGPVGSTIGSSAAGGAGQFLTSQLGFGLYSAKRGRGVDYGKLGRKASETAAKAKGYKLLSREADMALQTGEGIADIMEKVKTLGTAAVNKAQGLVDKFSAAASGDIAQLAEIIAPILGIDPFKAQLLTQIFILFKQMYENTPPEQTGGTILDTAGEYISNALAPIGESLPTGESILNAAAIAAPIVALGLLGANAPAVFETTQQLSKNVGNVSNEMGLQQRMAEKKAEQQARYNKMSARKQAQVSRARAAAANQPLRQRRNTFGAAQGHQASSRF